MKELCTLAKGGRSRIFGYDETADKVVFFTGSNLDSTYNISSKAIEELLIFFREKGWFMLGNQVDNIKPNGLGDYFKSVLGDSPKYASHLASYLVNKDKLMFRDDYGFLEFKIK